VIPVQDYPTVDEFPPVAEIFETEVINEEIAVYGLGEANEGGHHLLVGSNGIDEIAVHVQLDIGGEDVVADELHERIGGMRGDVRAEDGYTSLLENAGDRGVSPDPDLGSPRVVLCDIGCNQPFNMFKPLHGHE